MDSFFCLTFWSMRSSSKDFASLLLCLIDSVQFIRFHVVRYVLFDLLINGFILLFNVVVNEKQ